MAKAPLRLPPPWSTKRAVASKTRNIGTSPLDLPPVERMYECEARTCESERPTPPAEREMSAHCRSESKIPSMESSAHVRRKHEAWGGGVATSSSFGAAGGELLRPLHGSRVRRAALWDA